MHENDVLRQESGPVLWENPAEGVLSGPETIAGIPETLYISHMDQTHSVLPGCFLHPLPFPAGPLLRPVR